jgi:hypothetical protein
MAKLFCIFTVLAMAFLLIIELFSLRGTASLLGFLVGLGFCISAIGSGIFLAIHIAFNK